MARKAHQPHFARDAFILGTSILAAILLAKTHAIEIITAGGFSPVEAVIAGFFFTSLLTIAPAGVALAEMGQTVSPLTLSLWGAAGAVTGDLILFFFVRDAISDDVMALLRGHWSKKIKALFRSPYLSWAVPVCGALVIASPLPDEIGIAMLGLSKTDLRFLIPVSYAMNFLGIFLLTSAAHVA